MEVINVIAVSTKKDLGWIRCAPVTGSGVWGDSGMHFDKQTFNFSGPGLYAVEYVNNAGLGNTDLRVTKMQKVLDFSEYIESEK